MLPLGELHVEEGLASFVGLVVLLELGHVFVDVHSEDAIAVLLGVVFLVLLGVEGEAGESSVVVGDVETAIAGALECAEDSVA